jgi:hypothetical protein
MAAVLLLSLPTFAADSLDVDRQALAKSAGTELRSDVLEMKFDNGSTGLRVLVLEFAPPNKEKPEQLKVKLSLATPIEGNADRSSNSVMSTGGLRDVTLAEKDGKKSITIKRSIDTVEKPNKNTQRILDRTAISYNYEIKGNTLILKGFSTEKPTAWGQLSFTVPSADITFK